ncbi:inner membrane complex suture component, putative [Plasmodium vinckei]|uniref:Inner membrane complex suture component, putative n=1 Tax=Plasmodium vinckei TaxID=5860 RepID=A0A6V7SJC0_PLAVN|nr:inner membrane complex suture component, putative [Plasmodium vinckei]
MNKKNNAKSKSREEIVKSNIPNEVNSTESNSTTKTDNTKNVANKSSVGKTYDISSYNLHKYSTPETIISNGNNMINGYSYDKDYVGNVLKQNTSPYPYNNTIHNYNKYQSNYPKSISNNYYGNSNDSPYLNEKYGLYINGDNDKNNVYTNPTCNASNQQNGKYSYMKQMSHNSPNVIKISDNNHRRSQNRRLFSTKNILPPKYGRYRKMDEEDLYMNANNFNLNPNYNSYGYQNTTNFPSRRNRYNSLCHPGYSNYRDEYPYIDNFKFRNIPQDFYYLGNDEQGEDDDFPYLKRGRSCSLGGCKLGLDKCSSKPEYGYIIQGPNFSHVIDSNSSQKCDVFKKVTLKVGTYLDNVVNIVIDMLENSYKSIAKNNNTNVYDLYPFYNPDPDYTRKERPTLKTGNNILDKINSALDGTTLEKHKKLPKNFGRIAVPKTQETGSRVVDGINSMLDNLLNEPISYQKYDYYSDKYKNVKSGREKPL